MKNHPSGSEPTNQETLHLVLFKGNLTSRAFKVPLTWFTRIGWIFGALIVLVLGLSLMSARYSWKLRSSDSSRIEVLEDEIEILQKQNEVLQGQLSESRPQDATSSDALDQTDPSTVTSAAPPLTADSLASVPAAQRFALLPAPSISNPLPTTETLPFTLTPPTLTWRARMLSVKFAFQYTKGDGGKQEGRFILLARGPSHLLTYPEGILPSSLQGTPLIAPQRGEFFSVSRYREVQAEFGPVGTSADLTEVQVLIFNSQGELILSQALKTQSQATTGSASQGSPPTKPSEEKSTP